MATLIEEIAEKISLRLDSHKQFVDENREAAGADFTSYNDNLEKNLLI
jgi:hypothetical protein